MTAPETAVLIAYFFVLSILGIYGWHRYYLVYQYMKHKDRAPGPPPAVADEDLPRVTIQLPIFNEMYVVDRLVDAVCRIDYPKDKLDIQVLDDSIDETCDIARLAVQRQASRGFDITYHHRTDRTGFKAGALDAGLKTAKGEFVAIFDADFVPPSDFLMRTVPYFTVNEKLAVVQARWGHLNHDYSALTRIQAILLDGHFVLEHGGRNRSGCFFNFNGTSGVWRKIAIADGGGWQHDTLTEDLDLSYRTQLRGWNFLFLPNLVTPAEVPVEMNAFKSQQHRWAKGSIQTCRKVLPYLLQSQLPLKVKVEAFFHLTANFNYVLMVVLSILMWPAMVVRYNMGWTEMLLIDIPLFAAATLSVFNFYLISQRETYPDWRTRALYLPMVMAVGIGLAVNNTKAVIEAMRGTVSPFVRTPKYGIRTNGDGWRSKKYHQALPIQPLVEVAFGLYFTGAVIYALQHDIYGTLPFLVLFQVGFLYTGLLSIFQQIGGDDLLVKAPQIAGGK
ncbi:MAG TPA: cellulose synthase family protein [Vicinamibacterales bacterium]|nr:cellulose synthase family protein [Vicinamibacterales bacterium]